MRVAFPMLISGLFLWCGNLLAQGPPQETHAPASSTKVIRVGTQLVIVDVTVQDANGHPVLGLKRGDFTLTEGKQPQSVPYFEEHSESTSVAPGPQLPPMPPGTFTDYTSVPATGALNILLLDSLNTPMADQAYVRDQLQKYVRKAKPGTRIAIFGLSRNLFLLQGFSSDPQVLKDAVDHKLRPRASSLLDDTTGSGVTGDAPSDTVAGMTSDNSDTNAQLSFVSSAMHQFEAEQSAFQTQLRIQYTVDAFDLLAHYLSAFPGRKNLIWFSGSFPINILPDPTLSNGFSVIENNDPEFREMTNLLSRAQVAVYPIDARGLMADPTFSAAGVKRDRTGKGSSDFIDLHDNEHTTMSQLAEETGGSAFFDTNDLASAVQRSIEDGANYYTLVYSPANHDWDGQYRQIRVSLNGNLQAAGYRLMYRRGYYADNPGSPSKASAAALTTAASVTSTSSGGTYARAAMAHGAPTPADILFKARVLPLEGPLEQTLARDNNINAAHVIKPPFRRFIVDVAAVADAFQLTLNPDGRRTGTLEFSALLYDNDGLLLNATGKTVQLNMTADVYKQFLTGVKGHLEISVPVRGVQDFLRVGIHDMSSNRFGVVEIPISSIARLTPLSTSSVSATPGSNSAPSSKPTALK